MASDAEPRKVCYNVYMPSGSDARCYAFDVPDGAKVQDLEDAIRGRWSQKVKDEEIFLYKCGNEPILPRDTRFNRVSDWLRKHAESMEMEPALPLDTETYFPSGPAPSRGQKIDVIVATRSILENPDVLYALPERHTFRISKERSQRITGIRSLPSPSEGVRDEAGIKECIKEEHGVHAHRPAENYGPPTALFNHALARLKHRLEHLDQLQELEPSSDQLSSCHRFIVASCNVRDSEKGHEDTVRVFIEGFIGDRGSWQTRSELGTAKADATWGDPVRLILKLKNEDGLGGNATFQAVIVYGKIVSQAKYKDYVERSNCPVIIIGMMGNRLEISTAVFTDGIYLDKLLSQELYRDIWQAEGVLRLGRIFRALSLSTAELHEYYNMLKRNITTNPHPNPLPSATYLYPDPLPAEESQHIPTLSYYGKLSHAGRIIEFFQSDQEEVMRERPYALYMAKMVHGDPAREAEVVVKFTAHYNKRAHEILAEKGLAPSLHFYAPVLGGLHMIVMDYFKTMSLYDSPIPSNYSNIFDDVKTAIELLHEENLVFGDLRAQNIIPKQEGGAMLIDFDWVGEHKKDRYPASWNDGEPGTWADGVGRRMIMDKAHDTFRLGKVREYLECAKKT